jgi:hypothetical protein
VADLLGDLAHRMLGQVQPEELLLPAQAFAHRDLGGGGQRPLERDRVVGGHVEQRGLARDPVALRRLPGRDRVVEPEQDLAGCPNAFSAPTLRQRLEHLPVRQAQVDARAEVDQRLERPALVARGDDRLDRTLADVLDREQPEPDRVALDGELEVARVDVGGSTAIPSRRHSATAAATFSSFARNAVSTRSCIRRCSSP